MNSGHTGDVCTSSAGLCVKWKTCVAFYTVIIFLLYMPLLKKRTNITNPATCEVGSVTMILNTNNVHLAEINSHIDEVLWWRWNKGSMGKWCGVVKEGRTIVCDEQSGHTNSSSGRFSRMPHMVTTLHQIIITCFTTSRYFWQPRVWGVTMKQKTLCTTGWKAWQQPFSTNAYKSWSHNISALMYVSAVWRSSVM